MEHAYSFLGLLVAAVPLGLAAVQLKVGRLSLLAIPLLTAVTVLTPLEAAIIGVVGNIARVVRTEDSSPRWARPLNSAFWASTGAVVHDFAITERWPFLAAATAAVFATIVVNWITTTLGAAYVRRVPLWQVARDTFDVKFFLTYAYFAMSAILASSLFDGSMLGWIRVGAVFALSLTLVTALSEHIAGESMRKQLMVIDERIAFGQEAEAALHAVKNQLLLSSIYLEEIAPERLTPEDRDALNIVFESLQQSADVLRRTSASGRAANAPVYADADLVDLVRAVVVLGEARAAQRQVRLSLSATAKAIPVYVDGLLIREIVTNLVQNGIEVLDGGGHVDLTVGVRPDGSPFVEVTDDGPGLAPEKVAALFASRTSSKQQSGAGIGLTLSHAIATQHGGRLSYVKRRRRGTTFRLVLPPRDAARAQLSGGQQLSRPLGHTTDVAAAPAR